MDSIAMTRRTARRLSVCLLLLAAYAVWFHVLLSLAGALGASLASST
jgi:hypothetical protein